VIDLHVHTTASDGLLAPAALVARAAAAGISILSVTDHDTVAGLDEAGGEAARLGVRLVTGIEITAAEGASDVHLLGYFFDPADARLLTFLDGQRRERVRRVAAIADRLADLGCAIDREPLLASAAACHGRSIGRPHIADALVAAGHARDRSDAFDRLLGRGRPAFLPRSGAPPEAVIDLVARAGGIVPLAHPALLQLDSIIPRLAGAGLAAIEVRHAEHDAKAERQYREIANQYGLAVSGGSDFHADEDGRPPSLGAVTLPADDFAALESCAP
jgi:3',5'-nucleoside bisphosphate phosphatase